MFGFGLQISQNLQALLESQNPDLKEVIEDESCVRGFKSHYKSLTEFLTDHAYEVLKLALSDEKISIKAYQLFTPETEVLVKKLTEDSEKFEEVAKSIFVPDPNIVSINRFAYITQLAVIAQQKIGFSFIEEFFKFLHLRAVFGIFESIFNKTENTSTDIPKEMVASGLMTKIVDYLTSLKDATSTEAEGQICSIYKLISLFIQAEIPEIDEFFKSKEVVEKLLIDFTAATPRILGGKWAAINDVISKENAPLFDSKIDELISYLKVESGAPFHPHQVESIRVLTQLAAFSEAVRAKLVEANVAQLVVAIASSYRTFTFAQLAIIDFCIKTLPFSDISGPTVEELLKLASSFIVDDKSIAGSRAFAWQLITELKKSENEVAKEAIEKLEENAKVAYEKIATTIETEYGGPIPEAPQFGEDSLGNLSPEQIMALLKFLTGGAN